ncbi:ependymin-like 1 isoform X2 [Cyprinodon tularosa]|uniref:ependymin-like 1 isoform X2 n=1 Tax=Cyprinodon tularosa TaxID=77115 RepID=UPI0018E27B22|nr:ependymin-like 1 isoform X2 [Cyprinodon tularosa]
MRALALLVCLSVGCLAQRPQPCSSPALLTGSLTISTQDEKWVAVAKYIYDALGERIRLREIGSYDNKTFTLNVLLLYRQGVLYKISERNKTCEKKRLNRDFHPLAIPKDANLLGQAVLGSSSGPGQGVLVNTWIGQLEMKNRTAKYMSTVTEFGCVPISTLVHTPKNGWMVTSFYNNVIGLRDPQQLIPPSFCKDAKLDKNQEEDPVDFYSLF